MFLSAERHVVVEEIVLVHPNLCAKGTSAADSELLMGKGSQGVRVSPGGATAYARYVTRATQGGPCTVRRDRLDNGKTMNDKLIRTVPASRADETRTHWLASSVEVQFIVST